MDFRANQEIRRGEIPAGSGTRLGGDFGSAASSQHRGKVRTMRQEKALRIVIHTLGCAKNLVDSERLAGAVCQAGGEFVRQTSRADVLVVNTCGFVDDAIEESAQTLLEALRWKKAKNGRRVMVMGCLSQRDGASLTDEMPELDGVFGIGEWARMLEALHLNPLGNGGMPKGLADGRLALSGPGSAYLRISDGCSMGCSFCSIPQMRGFLRSEPMEKLLIEARALAATGVRELILIGQETTSYGVDLYGRRRLIELLWRLAEIPELCWLRVLYLHPPSTTPKFLEELARVPKLCPYLDFPIEHASDRLLKRMNRHASAAQMREAIAAFRQARPDACVRTSVMVGFPGETQAEFDELYRFIDEVRFERAGAFVFSAQEGTLAVSFPDCVEEGVALDRVDRIMKLQRRICREKHAHLIGRVMEVLIERTRGGQSWGRTVWDAPEIDAEVRVPAALTPGDIVPVEITSASAYRLDGVPLVNGHGEGGDA